MSTDFKLPRFGLGTYRLTGQAVIDSVNAALELGYRAIDTAQIYGNEAEIGQAIIASEVPRADLFLTTKIWVEHHGREALLRSLRESLAKLRTDHVDLTLIHWPAPGRKEVPMSETLSALAEARELGLTRAIGVSNFNIELTRQAVAQLGAGATATNQIELSPYLQNRKLVDELKALRIPITSYMTLAYAKVLKDPVIDEIAAQRGATPAQVALAWAMQLGYAVIPSSTKRANLASNLRAQTLRLSDADMVRIAQLDRGGREVNPEGLAPVWD